MRLGVGVIITRPDGAILLGRRVYPNAPECWCLPGGKVDPGEDLATAAARETLEECGLVLPALAPAFALITDTHDGGPWITAGFAITVAASATACVTEPEKLAEWRWFAPGALPAPLFSATRAVLAAWRGETVPGTGLYPLAR